MEGGSAAEPAEEVVAIDPTEESTSRVRLRYGKRFMLHFMSVINADLQFPKDWTQPRANHELKTGKMPAIDRVRTLIVRDAAMQRALNIAADSIPISITLAQWVDKAMQERADRKNAPGGENSTGGTSTSEDCDVARALDQELDSFEIRCLEAKRGREQGKKAGEQKGKRAVRVCLFALVAVCCMWLLLQMAIQLESVVGLQWTKANKRPRQAPQQTPAASTPPAAAQ